MLGKETKLCFLRKMLSYLAEFSVFPW
uniref:Uncharacterized protein n=1 Tax=Rhizophora mucronata TaxID=61149 RepID=A0A2P2MNU8_RHIMU